MKQRRNVRARVHRFDATGLVRSRADKLAGEEPLEIRLDGHQYAVTMRTPGADVELVAGFLLSEAVVTGMHQIRRIDFSAGLAADGSRNYNVAEVTLVPGTWSAHAGGERQVYTSSSCGICGTAAIEAVTKDSAFPLPRPDAGADTAEHTADPLITPARLLELPDRLRDEQPLFDSTGGVHAAALFKRGADPDDVPELLVAREDVGRHNAVDKVVGWAMQNTGLPLYDCVLQVSARASFELVQKAAMAGIPILSAVSAPSALAVEYGKETGVTVIGFNRGKTFNAYSHNGRIRQ